MAGAMASARARSSTSPGSSSDASTAATRAWTAGVTDETVARSPGPPPPWRATQTAMRIGIFVQVPGLDDFVTEVGAAAERGFATVWTPQIFGFDALTALALAGREVPGIELGTAVVPTYPRHPMVLAAAGARRQSALRQARK